MNLNKTKHFWDGQPLIDSYYSLLLLCQVGIKGVNLKKQEMWYNQTKTVSCSTNGASVNLNTGRVYNLTEGVADMAWCLGVT